MVCVEMDTQEQCLDSIQVLVIIYRRNLLIKRSLIILEPLSPLRLSDADGCSPLRIKPPKASYHVPPGIDFPAEPISPPRCSPGITISTTSSIEEIAARTPDVQVNFLESIALLSFVK